MKIFLLIWIAAGMIYAKEPYANALATEDSPYLRQHAHNPVQWYPWGEAALQKAQKENKLIFLSIGYSTCHWCHVMEEESFSDVAIAKLINKEYISIKVDKETLPQLDKKYQALYSARYHKRGGWPLNVFLSPQGEVLHIATYIPPEEGYGSKGMMEMLPFFAKEFHAQSAFIKNEIDSYKKSEPIQNKKSKDTNVEKQAMDQITDSFDRINGGFASKPKFPEASKLELLLTIYRLNKDTNALKMAQTTLQKMARGGIYDQVDGGFFRYTPDAAWQVPHFEKMLYTNAQMADVYIQAYRLTKDPFYWKIAQETIAQVERDFQKQGLYLSASDADSDGEEGGYFVYAYDAVKQGLLDRGFANNEAEAALAYFGIEENGNVDGELSHAHLAKTEPCSKCSQVRGYLKELRKSRTFPFVDAKVNTAWNAMMIKTLFEASVTDPSYLKTARERMKALLGKMRRNEKLYHQSLVDKIPIQDGILEDYAYLIEALITGYQQTYEERYLQQAKSLLDEALKKFYKKKLWYLSDDGIQAKADLDDRYYTSPLSVMLDNLLRFSALSEELEYYDIAKETIVRYSSFLESSTLDASRFVQVTLHLNRGDVIIKSTIGNLQKYHTEMNTMMYPFILSKPEESSEYLACKINSCFAHVKQFDELKEKIENDAK